MEKIPSSKILRFAVIDHLLRISENEKIFISLPKSRNQLNKIMLNARMADCEVFLKENDEAKNEIEMISNP